MEALHLTADLYGCRCDVQWLSDAGCLRAWCESALAQATRGEPAAAFRAGSIVSGTVLVPGAQLSIHTDPLRRSATADVLVAASLPEAGRIARLLVDALVERLQPEWTEQRSLTRGDEA